MSAKPFNHKFSLIEGFAATCPSVCDQPNIDSSIKTACDVGSQSYCTTQPNIGTPECINYADRLIRTIAAEKTGIQYANKVMPPSNTNTANYYNAILDSSTQYIMNNITNSNAVKLIFALDTADPSFKHTNAIVRHILNSRPSLNELEKLEWFTKRLDILDTAIVDEYKDAKFETLLNYMSQNVMFQKYPNILWRTFDLLGRKIQLNDMLLQSPNVNRNALLTLRSVSNRLRVAMDSLIISNITDGKISSAMDNPTISNKYDTNLSGYPNLYSSQVRSYYNTLKNLSTSSTDKLVGTIAEADAVNKKRAFTVNASTDSVCIAMRLTGEPDLVQTIDLALSQFCYNSANVADPNCISSLNKILVSGTSDDKVKIYRSVLDAASANTSGKLDDNIVNQYNGMKDWIKAMTTDAVTKDANNKVINISSNCGKPEGISIDQCNRVCATYPEMCASDQIQKCQLPEYRYKAIEGFSGECYDKNKWSEQSIIWIVLFILVAFIMSTLSINTIRKYMNANRNKASITSSNNK